MRIPTSGVAMLLAVAPVAMSAQASTANEKAHANANVNAELHASAQPNIPAHFSAEGRARLAAMYAEVKARGLSEIALSRRVSEGHAKGASEAAILAAAGQYQAHLHASQSAMIAAGRSQPRPDEVERGANAMARGVTSTQIETMTRRTPNERSLVVAFEVLTDLAARGVPVGKALAQVQGKLDSRASDAALRELGASVTTGATAGAVAGTGAGMSAAGAAGAAGRAAAPGKAGAAAGSITGSVTGVLRRPGGL